MVLGQDALLRAIRAAHHHVRPIVPGILAWLAVLIGQPLAVRRPCRAEIEMARLRGNPEPLPALLVAGPNLVARGTGEMIGHTPPIRTEAEAIGQPFARTRELAGVGAIEVHAE